MDMAVNLDLEWNEAYSLGHSRIDAQHQRLFDLYGRVVDAFNECKGHLLISVAIADLVAYTRLHFTDEEQFMESLGYPQLAEHQKQHQDLIREVEVFAQELEEGKPVLIYEVLGFLKEWLTTHILEEDMKLRGQIDSWR